MTEPDGLTRGHRERLRLKYRKAGHDGMLDYEKLELLLTYAIPRRDVKPMAKRLLERFGNIAGVFGASESELESVDGIGESAVVLLALVRGLGADCLLQKIERRSTVECSADVIRYARMKLAGLKKEAFMVFYLNTANEIQDTEILSEGTIDQMSIQPRELLASALKRNARSIIIVHNHPGGTAIASEEDLRLTEVLRTVAETMRIDLLDHIIITQNAAFSIGLNAKIQSGSEDLFVLRRTQNDAAEAEPLAGENAPNPDYARLPFHPNRIRPGTFAQIAQKGKKP